MLSRLYALLSAIVFLLYLLGIVEIDDMDSPGVAPYDDDYVP